MKFVTVKGAITLAGVRKEVTLVWWESRRYASPGQKRADNMGSLGKPMHNRTHAKSTGGSDGSHKLGDGGPADGQL